MMQQTLVKYIVAYGFQDKFELTEEEAQKLVKAAEDGLKLVKFRNRIFSTNFTWIVPLEQTKMHEFTSKELKLCEDVAEWLSRDVNNLDWSYNQAFEYSKKLFIRIGEAEVKKLFRDFAECAYPSVFKFLSEAKEVSGIDEQPKQLLLD